MIFKNHFHCRLVGQSKPFYCILIYQPPGLPGPFLSDFTEFLSTVIKCDKVLLIGDFNFHVININPKIASDFLNITESFNFSRHVSGPTHTAGHTLDLIDNVCWKDFPVSDHKCVLFEVS